MRSISVATAILLLVAACSEPGEDPTASPELTTLPPIPTVAPTGPEPGPPPLPPSGLCSSFTADPEKIGEVEDPEITETSGIAVSRNHPGTIWLHNDSGGGPFVYAVDTAGRSQGKYEVDALAFDWEDMSIGPGPEPGRDHLYIGDIGDNLGFRPAVTIYRFPEPDPDPDGGRIGRVESFDLVYPQPGLDAEALAVDSATGDILIITKGTPGNSALILRAAATELVDGQVVAMEQVGSFALEAGTFVTAADIAQDGSAIIFRGYNEVWLWERADLEFVETFAAAPCRTPSTSEVQGEAVAFTAGGFSYVTISEGINPDINRVVSDLDP